MNTFISRFLRLVPLLFDRDAVKAMVKWPVFSISAYQNVSNLFNQGICPRAIIDVGANIGQFTIAGLNIFEGVSIHAFEPIEACVNTLRINTSGYKDVYIHAIALGAKRDKTTFYINQYSQASSVLRPSQKHRLEFPNVAEEKAVPVELSTLDDFFSNSNLPGPVLLKLDVQGSEKLVLEGGKRTLKKVDFVLMETSFTPMYIGEPLFIEMIEAMKAIDFEFVRPIGFLKSPQGGEILQADILFRNTRRSSGIA
jgi:FkbM family methyltransferase